MKKRRPAVSLTRMERDVQKLDEARRRVLADWCRLVGRRVKADDSAPKAKANLPGQSPQLSASIPVNGAGRPVSLEQTVAGATEKQIAQDLSLSPHTIHTYVKQLHKRLNVSSRGELLSRFLDKRRVG